jgi:predicted O-linked N-acetylglucosamine transferase (SPINDLY family)
MPSVPPTIDASAVDVPSRLRRALEAQQRGDARTAEALYRAVLRVEPHNAAALHMLGVLATQAGEPARALEFLAASLAADPEQPSAHSNFGNALLALGRHAEAIVCFDRALALRPDYGVALANRGIAEIHLGLFPAAVASLNAALRLQSPNPALLLNRGIALAGIGRGDEALADYAAAGRLAPEYLEPVLQTARLLAKLGRPRDAVAAFARAAALAAGRADVHNDLAAALLRVGRVDEALLSADRALELDPALAEAHNNRGLALRRLQRLEAALESIDRALALRPGYPEALSNRGWVLLPLGRRQEAEESLNAALALRPDFVEALTTLGAVHKSAERLSEAFACFARALAIDANYPDALGSLASLLIETQRYPEALECLRCLLAVSPEHEYAAGNHLEAQLRCCDWSGYERQRDAILAGIAAGRSLVRPLFLLTLTDDPSLQLACARRYAQDNYAPRDAAVVPRSRSADASDRIRLAYVSGDFGDHAVGYLTAGLFERHDRARFEVVAVSLRPAQDSPLGRRIQSGVDRFVDVSAASDAGIAARMRELRIDIAIDLSGFTGAGRAGIFARRAAPVQVNYLGFPATMGLATMDYVLADRYLIPPESREFYAEQIAYLPHSFQVNDDRREIAATTPSRRECALPESAFVFASFNNCYKLNPPLFRTWLRLLDRLPSAVLWLVADTPWVEDHLRRFAESAGVAAQRLVFAPRRPYAAHLARLRVADLCLDALPFNGGTTTSDALWAGVPVLTCAGRAFAARMGASLLQAVGLPELVTHSLDDYEALALQLATEPGLLATLRARLARNRETAPLFDTARSCRQLEAAYVEMWTRQGRGEPPATFDVKA